MLWSFVFIKETYVVNTTWYDNTDQIGRSHSEVNFVGQCEARVFQPALVNKKYPKVADRGPRKSNKIQIS